MRDLTMTLRKLTIDHPERVATAHAVLASLGITNVADVAARYDALSGRECDAARKALAVVEALYRSAGTGGWVTVDPGS